MSRILPLPKDAVSQLHSSKHITSLEGVVIALLENSLDAGATKVEITVNFRRGACTVEDNGIGIPTSEFREDGGLGKPYHTSKHGTDGLHGCAGLFLSSLGALSLLMISSFASDKDEQATIILHQGRVVDRHIPSLPVHRLHTPENHGTRTTVRDLFGNMPVRVKQRDLSFDVSSGTNKVWQNLKLKIVALLLAWPKSCAVRLLDSETEDVVMTINGSRPEVSGELTEKALQKFDGKKPKFDVRDSLSLLFQGRLLAQHSRYNWIPLSASTSQISLRGIISLDPSPSKQNQFISIGIHPCSFVEFYEAVNKVFAQSRFAVEEGGQIPERKLEKSGSHDQNVDRIGNRERQLRSQKGVDKWPMFIFHLQLKELGRQRIDPDNPNEGSLKLIVDVLEATVTQWLSAHNFRPQKRKRGKEDEESMRPSTRASADMPSSQSQTSLVRRSSSANISKTMALKIQRRRRFQKPASLREAATDNQVFDTWSRIKTGRTKSIPNKTETTESMGPPTFIPQKARSNAQETARIFSPPVFNIGEFDNHNRRRGDIGERTGSPTDSREQEIPSDDFGSVNEEALLACEANANTLTLHDSHDPTVLTHHLRASALDEETNDEIVNWTDPSTKRILRINSRTGVVLPPEKVGNETASDSNPKRGAAAINTNLLSTGRPLSMSKRGANDSTPTESRWFPGFLKEWNNPVFTRQREEPIRMLSLNDPGVEDNYTLSRSCEDNLSRYFGAAGAAGSQKLSKAGLKRAQVVRQVDKKFILCKLGSSDVDSRAEILALVDQHAVSERVLLEKLLAELCAPAKQSSGEPTVLTNLKQSSSIETALLEKVLSFEISEEEKDLFTVHASHFARWGIMYDLSAMNSSTTVSQVRELFRGHRIIVRALPPSIAERCTLVPSLLIDLLRSEVWAVAEAPRRTTKQPNVQNIDPLVNTESHSWLADIGGCPQGLLNMINSRACRSAIMFNDQLTVEQCEALLKDVSKCAFPFMCAHGRVSMVPLLEMEDDDGSSGLNGLGFDRPNERDNNQGLNAYKEWMERK